MQETDKTKGWERLATFSGPNLFATFEAMGELFKELGARLATYRAMPNYIEQALLDNVLELSEIIDNLEALEARLEKTI